MSAIRVNTFDVLHKTKVYTSLQSHAFCCIQIKIDLGFSGLIFRMEVVSIAPHGGLKARGNQQQTPVKKRRPGRTVAKPGQTTPPPFCRK